MNNEELLKRIRNGIAFIRGFNNGTAVSGLEKKYTKSVNVFVDLVEKLVNENKDETYEKAKEIFD